MAFVCAGCFGTGARMQRCGGCHLHTYCSRACQRTHWASGHREECTPAAPPTIREPQWMVNPVTADAVTDVPVTTSDCFLCANTVSVMNMVICTSCGQEMACVTCCGDLHDCPHCRAPRPTSTATGLSQCEAFLRREGVDPTLRANVVSAHVTATVMDSPFFDELLAVPRLSCLGYYAAGAELDRKEHGANTDVAITMFSKAGEGGIPLGFLRSGLLRLAKGGPELVSGVTDILTGLAGLAKLDSVCEPRVVALGSVSVLEAVDRLHELRPKLPSSGRMLLSSVGVVPVACEGPAKMLPSRLPTAVVLKPIEILPPGVGEFAPMATCNTCLEERAMHDFTHCAYCFAPRACRQCHRVIALADSTPSRGCLRCHAEHSDDPLTMVRSLIRVHTRDRDVHWLSAAVVCVRHVLQGDCGVSDDLTLRLCRETRATAVPGSPFFAEAMTFTGARMCIMARAWGAAKSGIVDGNGSLMQMEAACLARGVPFDGTRRLMEEGMAAMRCAGAHPHAMFMLGLCISFDMNDDLPSCLEGLDLFRQAHAHRHNVGAVGMNVMTQIRVTVARVLLFAEESPRAAVLAHEGLRRLDMLEVAESVIEGAAAPPQPPQ